MVGRLRVVASVLAVSLALTSCSATSTGTLPASTNVSSHVAAFTAETYRSAVTSALSAVDNIHEVGTFKETPDSTGSLTATNIDIFMMLANGVIIASDSRSQSPGYNVSETVLLGNNLYVPSEIASVQTDKRWVLINDRFEEGQRKYAEVLRNRAGAGLHPPIFQLVSAVEDVDYVGGESKDGKDVGHYRSTIPIQKVIAANTGSEQVGWIEDLSEGVTSYDVETWIDEGHLPVTMSLSYRGSADSFNVQYSIDYNVADRVVNAPDSSDVYIP